MIKEETDTLSKWVLPEAASDADREQHAIPAAEVVEALQAGRDVEIANAIIVGPLTLRSLVIPGKLQIRHTIFRGPADWSYAVFKRVVSLEHSTFDDLVSLRSATLEHDLVLDHANFATQLTATYLTVAGMFSAESATFGSSPLFLHATFKQNASLMKAEFESGALFGWSRFESEANFERARFQKLASFNGVSIGGGSFFTEAIFEDKADFPDARFTGTAYFGEAQFRGAADFQGARAEANVIFTKAVFEDETNFFEFRGGGSLQFNEATVKGAAYFNSLQMDGGVFFERAKCEADLNMAASRIRGPINFQYATLKDADFSSSEIHGGMYFWGATFEGAGRFQNITTTRAVFNDASFKGDAIFYRIRCTDDALFFGTVFGGLVSFEGASFQSIQLGRPRVQFKQTVDLRGWTYTRLDPIEFWDELMDRLKPYDRQPYSQLEETLRRAGHDRTARDVYYGRRRRESRRIKLRTPLSWLLDRTLWLLTGYGVRLERLFIATALVLLVGTFAFQRQDAVIERAPATATGGTPVAPQSLTLATQDAFWFSLKLFVPVEIPAAGDWRPSAAATFLGLKMTTVATLLRLAGWILVPIALAGVTGFLKR